MIIGATEVIMVTLVVIFYLIIPLMFLKMVYKVRKIESIQREQLEKIDSIQRELNRIYRELK
ncbi:hypothetical protein [Methanosarcina mazei]|uniref:Uncharacterized protein n=1 Tax=Methanosarcina mazei TaxID=2209 RepID=A0A0F8SF15_METMZ|nr:hypothetical protein [Methanosarcina mazei]KKF99462.1 hypothetical protein DU47_00420 [Methanosarcina mazei]KKH88765.1 hypothetical protein DU80_12255 [Methanosarcina mazei]NLO30952.1 hypothetical protein [Methanosarcina mazei]